MKLVIALIQPHKLPDVKKALFDANITRITVSNVLGAGSEKGYIESYRGVEEEINLLKKIRIEIAVNDNFVEHVVKAVIKGAKTGEAGDGKIFIQSLAECIRIRTGEKGSKAVG